MKLTGNMIYFSNIKYKNCTSSHSQSRKQYFLINNKNNPLKNQSVFMGKKIFLMN